MAILLTKARTAFRNVLRKECSRILFKKKHIDNNTVGNIDKIMAGKTKYTSVHVPELS